MLDITQIIATELNVKPAQVAAATALLDEGATVPFIARYRKEVTGGLSDTDLRTLEERLAYLREMEARRETIIASITEQGKLTPELLAEIQAADTKARLEDLYKPYKPKRRTKGQIAIEAGLQPLADVLYNEPNLIPETEAAKYITEEIKDIKAALEGARYILMERFADDANLVGKLRDLMWEQGVLTSAVSKGKEEAGAKYKDYFNYQEQLKKIPSHRVLALLRGRNEEFLALDIVLAEQDCPAIISAYFGLQGDARAAANWAWLQEVCKWTWQVKLKISLELEMIATIRESAEEEAIKVFAKNVSDLMMAPPAGNRSAIGLDPGLRTGVKLAVIDATGKFIEHAVIYPHAPQNQWDDAIAKLAALCVRHKVNLIGIGNGTASRETEALVQDLMKKYPELMVTKVVVSEAGASVYSASEFAAKEFPNVDVSIRGAISIARRLQDPLAELVKIDPKAIGVGQYQHDVSPGKLAKALDATVEDCVNKVGVDLNTASAPLLTRVSGLNQSIASNIVEFREQNGPFTNREQLKLVSRLKDKAFEQCAGFLKIANGTNPLDASSVHPEAYPVVTKILTKAGREIKAVIGDVQFLKQLKPQDYVDETFGVPTVKDIISELEKPGRDPRAQFRTVQYKDGVNEIKDLKPEMVLEGVVTNVANFGAFVDIGVHQDGLVHISELTDKFVADPREVVKVGDIVTVKVLDVDAPRKRISLTLRLHAKVAMAAGSSGATRGTAGTIMPAHGKFQDRAKTTGAVSTARGNKATTSQNTSTVFGSALLDAFEGKG